MDVEPIGIIRSKFLVGASLDNIDPLGDFELTSALKVSGIGLDELWRKLKIMVRIEKVFLKRSCDQFDL